MVPRTTTLLWYRELSLIGSLSSFMTVPAFRFLYNEEKVARDPTNIPRYANGTARLIQSTIFATQRASP